MSVLEWFAWLGATCTTIGFAVAWDMQNNFGAQLRRQTKLFGWLIIGLSKKPVGWMVGFATVIALLFAPNNQGLRFYRHRRAWQPTHRKLAFP